MTIRRKSAPPEIEQPPVDPLEAAIERARQAVAESEAAESERLRLLVESELGGSPLDSYSSTVSQLSAELADRKAVLSGLLERQAANVRTARQERAAAIRQEAADLQAEGERLTGELDQITQAYLARANELKSRRERALSRATERRNFAQLVQAGRF